jgi:hypothetical protein
LKKYCLLLIICLNTFYSQAQERKEITKKKSWLTENVKEKYEVLKSDNKIKKGLYEAIYTGTNTVIARGHYEANEKVGIWYFWDIHARLVEAFDYTNNRLLSEEPVNAISRQYIWYAFDQKLRDSDRITKPLHIGGRCYGYIPYLQIFHLTKNYAGIDLRFLNATLEILVSPGGRLADLKVHIIAPDNSDNVTSFSPDIFSERDKEFIPATINGKPVMSRIFLACQITYDGTLDVD